MKGRIIKGVGGYYEIENESNEVHTCRPRGKLRRGGFRPLTGDFVTYTPSDGKEPYGTIEEILPRKNALIRPPVANVDQLVIMISAGIPQFDPLLVDRLLVYAYQGKMSVLICVNKIDLDEEGAVLAQIKEQYAAFNVLALCAQSEEGIASLRSLLSGKVNVLCGQSGVGKSSWVNLLSGIRMETGELSDKSARGRHTTRHTQLIRLDDTTYLIDTPGFSLLENERAEEGTLADTYPEFAPFLEQCRFDTCRHDKEPGCAVRNAVKEGLIPRKRYERYRILLHEQQELWRKQYD